MGSFDSALKKYYRSIRQELPCSWKMKKQIMQQIQDNVDLFREQNPSADFAAIQAHFGTTQEIASSYIDDQDAPALLRKMRIKKSVLMIVVGTMALVFVIWLVATMWAIFDTNKTNDGHVDEGIIVVE